MKRVYSHPNSMMVGSMAGLLEQSGIESELRNDILGGASGEIAPGETWVELWVKDASQADRAIQIIQESMQQAEGEDWQCTRCDESNPASFDTCWKCGALGSFLVRMICEMLFQQIFPVIVAIRCSHHCVYVVTSWHLR